MRDIGSVFRDYARLDLQRMDRGLTVPELERWASLKKILDGKLRGSEKQRDLERRSSKRIATRLRCAYASCAELRQASITQLATGGVFIATKSPLPVGTKLELRIHIADSDTRIEVGGAVVSNNIAPDTGVGEMGMGIRFSRVSQEAIEKIAQLYATEAEREHEGQGAIGAENGEAPPQGAEPAPARRFVRLRLGSRRSA